MSLISFHRFLIAAGIAFCLGYSGFQLAEYSESGARSDLVLAIVFVTLGLGLAYYLTRLASFLGTGKSSDR